MPIKTNGRGPAGPRGQRNFGPQAPPDLPSHTHEDAEAARRDSPLDTRLKRYDSRGLEVSEQTRSASRFQGRRVREMSKEQALYITKTRQQVADDFRRFFEEKWSRWHAQYRQVMQRQRDGANRPSPEPFIIIETLMPRVVKAIFSLDPSFGAKPLDPGSEEMVETAIQLLDSQWKGPMRITEVMIDVVKYALKYGTSIGKMVWTDDVSESVHMVDDMDPETGMSTGRRVGQLETEQRASFPELLPVPLYDFWIEPHARSIDEADFCIHQTWVPEPVLRQLEEEGIYEGVGTIAIQREAGQTAGHEAYRSGSSFGEYGRDYKLKRSGQYSPFDFTESIAPLVKVWEYWGSYYDEDGKRYPNMTWTVADENVVISPPRPNPFAHGQKPFVSCVAHKDEDEFYGIGFLEAVEPTQVSIAALENMATDNMVYAIQRMFLMGRGANLPVNSIRWRPFGVIPVEDVNQFRQLEVTDIVPSAIEQRTHLEQQAKMLTGTTDFVRAESSNLGGDTATEVVQSINQSNLRFGLLLTQFQNFMRRVLHLQHELNKQFIDTPQAIRIVGSGGHRWDVISGEDIGGQLDFEMLGDEESGNTDASRQRMMLLFEKFLVDPVIRQTIDIHEWVSMAMELFKIPGKDKILIDPADFESMAFKSLSPQEELFHMLQGKPHVTRPDDDHEYHKSQHLEQWYEIPSLRPQLEQAIFEHEQAQTQIQQGMNQQLTMGAMGMLNVPPGAGAGAMGGSGAGAPLGPQMNPSAGAGRPSGLGNMGATAPWRNAV